MVDGRAHCMLHHVEDKDEGRLGEVLGKARVRQAMDRSFPILVGKMN